jgi:predicted 2-oxoglutarate/Fe(II)-dependent dioxygenase YbiX
LIATYYKPEEEKAAHIGGIGGEAEGGRVDLQYRKANVCWIPTSDAISLLLFSKSLVANQKAGWDFDIEDCEPTQIAKYEQGSHHNWHTDENFFIKSRGYHRKISSVLFLSDPNTYTGGEFLFSASGEEQKVEVGIGTILCFPSEHRHKVAPVTYGVRYSLASWATGPLMR